MATTCSPPFKDCCAACLSSPEENALENAKASAACTGAPDSVSIIEAGGTALSKGYAGLIALLGGRTAVATAVSGFWEGETTGVRVTLVGGSAVFLAAAVMLFGAAPRWAAVRGVFFAAAVVVSYMGQALQLSERQMRLSPFHAVGDAPGAAVSVTGVTVLLLLSAGLTVFGLGAFRRRDVPKG